MRHVLRFTLTLALVLTAQLIAASPAQAEIDSRWLPWIGCWQSAVERAAGNDQRACFVPLPDGKSVQRILVSPGDSERTNASARALIADGVEYPATYASCPGTLRTEWSSDGRRFFTTLASQCTDQPSTKASGIGFLLPGPAWIDVQVVESGANEEVQVRRYRRTTVPDELSGSLPEELIAQAEAASVTLGARRLTIDQVIDASARTTPHGIEAALLEANMRFALDSAALRALDKAHVNENVIDLMVALTFPQHFAVDKPASSGGSGSGSGYFGAPSNAYWDNSYSYDPFCDASYSYCPYYLSSISRFYALPYYASSVVIIGPGGGGGSGYPVSPDNSLPKPPNALEPARAINGQGYTHVRPAEAVPVSPDRGPSNSFGRATASSAGSGEGSSSNSGSSSGGGGGNSGSSGGGYSSGGGGGDTGRTAVPR